MYITVVHLHIWWFSHQVMSNSCDPMGCSLPGSSVHGILAARILEWIAISFSRESFPPRTQTQVSTLQADSLSTELQGKLIYIYIYNYMCIQIYMGFPGRSAVKNLPAMQKMPVQSLGQEDTLEKGMATHSSILPWEIP